MGSSIAMKDRRPCHVERNIFAAITPAMKSARLERIPLHSFATSIVMPGRWKNIPSRWTGDPDRLNRNHATSADLSCRKTISGSSICSGTGTINKRKSRGNTEARDAFFP